MMIDRVPDARAGEGVRPLNLSGKSTQQRGGNRNLKGADRRHQLYGQGTCATHGQAATSSGWGMGSANAVSPSSRRL
jgi:hypothetical protein